MSAPHPFFDTISMSENIGIYFASSRQLDAVSRNPGSFFLFIKEMGNCRDFMMEGNCSCRLHSSSAATRCGSTIGSHRRVTVGTGDVM